MPQADDLGFLLHKHPDKAQSFDTAAGTAHVFWPESGAERATAALLLEVDPVTLVRGKGGRDNGSSLAQYVNDRPYAASSMLAVALSRVFRTAMTRRCDARPELVNRPLPLEITLPVLPSRGGPAIVEQLFAPLGWTVTADVIPLDETVPAWGDSRYCRVRLTGEVVLADALAHLYVLMPVLNDNKHYSVSADEVEKLLRAGGTWLPEHPDRDLITRRYLAHQRAATRRSRSHCDFCASRRPYPLRSLSTLGWSLKTSTRLSAAAGMPAFWRTFFARSTWLANSRGSTSVSCFGSRRVDSYRLCPTRCTFW